MLSIWKRILNIRKLLIRWRNKLPELYSLRWGTLYYLLIHFTPAIFMILQWFALILNFVEMCQKVDVTVKIFLKLHFFLIDWRKKTLLLYHDFNELLDCHCLIVVKPQLAVSYCLLLSHYVVCAHQSLPLLSIDWVTRFFYQIKLIREIYS